MSSVESMKIYNVSWQWKPQHYMFLIAYILRKAIFYLSKSSIYYWDSVRFLAVLTGFISCIVVGFKGVFT